MSWKRKNLSGKLKWLLIPIFCACILLTIAVPRAQASSEGEEQREAYGVFVGLNPDQIDRTSGFQTIVIDGAEFTGEDIEKLHREGKIVYSYLNIGSVEKFRDYYPLFSGMTLGEYENWPDERWVDVSRSEWRNYLVDVLAGQLAGKGIDGFFLDNADVWYQYQDEKIYRGLIEILRGLGKYEIPLVINGGDSFVTAAMDKGDLDGLIDGVNQETVFTAIDFEKGGFRQQSPEETDYFKEYLARCKAKGLSVYLTEYGAEPDLQKIIQDFCEENGYFVYIADSIGLD